MNYSPSKASRKNYSAYTLWVLVVGAVIDAIADAPTDKGQSMGWIANIAAGLVDSLIKEKVLNSRSPHVVGMVIMSPIIGTIILTAVVSFFFG